MLRRMFGVGLLVLVLGAGAFLVFRPKPPSPPNHISIQIDTIQRTGGLAVDDEYLYWADSKAGTITRYNTTSLCSHVLIHNQTYPNDLMLHENYLYWHDVEDQMIRRMPKTGGTVEDIALTKSQNTQLYVDATGIYWAEPFDSNNVFQIAHDGSSEPKLLMNVPQPQDLARIDDQLYILSDQGVVQLDLKHGTSSMVGPGIGYFYEDHTQIIADSSSVYWIDSEPVMADVYTYASSSQPPSMLLDERHDRLRPHTIAQDEMYLYGISGTFGTITRIKKPSDNPEQLFQSPRRAITIEYFAVDDTWLYWIESGFLSYDRIIKTLKSGATPTDEQIMARCQDSI